MKRFKRPSGGASLPAAAWLAAIHAFDFMDWTTDRLAARLRACGPDAAEAYGILREIILRETGLLLFDSQLLTARTMARGRIAQLPTGEGKTLAAVVTASLFALHGRRVHILVFNDYLASRDWRANRAVYGACGLTCGHIVEQSDFAQRKAAYACDIVYVTAKEAGFDCLRDFLCVEKEKLLLSAFPAALIDEADSILIDEARIPLVLAGESRPHASPAAEISRVVAALPAREVGVSVENNQAWLTERGAGLVEARMGLENLFLEENADTLAMINAALEARFLLHRDKDYIVKDGAIALIDEATGRIAENRRFPDLLHQAVEVRELGAGSESSVIYNTTSMQGYLRQYELICGMTGTAASSAYEFGQMYDLEIDVIAPHTPCIRIDHPDAVFLEKDEQEAAILACVRAAHAKGQPILMGTQSVRESEHFSALLAAEGIPHSVLNARNDEEEAAIVEEAGRPYQVTISTNMAGRGVDIRLGGRSGAQADLSRGAGGLLVISTGINRSLRIDDQLRGRAGRQGDPGESRFFVCLKDLTLETFLSIEQVEYKRYPRLLRRAQRAQERRDVEARYMLARYSGILEEQRRRIARWRTSLLTGESSPEIMRERMPEKYRALCMQAGARGVALAERQLTLYFINTNWAAYLEAMEERRTGIHLVVIGKKSPLDEYMHFAAAAFVEMLEDIAGDVMEHMQSCTITEDGIDMETAGLLAGTTTWTYMINESSSQFSRLPELVKAVSAPIKGTLFTLHGIYAKVRDAWRSLRGGRKE